MTTTDLIRTALDLADTCERASVSLYLHVDDLDDARRILAALAQEQPSGAVHLHASSVSIGFGRVTVFVPKELFVSEPQPQPEMRPLADVLAEATR
jgi:hypothetical protein